MTSTLSTATRKVGPLVRKTRLHLANLVLPAQDKVDVSDGSQGHLTLAFPMKSQAGISAVGEELASLQKDLYDAADAIGTVHYCRFVAVEEGNVYLLADFDGRLDDLLEGLAAHLGPILDPVLEHVSDPPPTPVARNRTAFVSWAKAHCIKPFAQYSAYPGATALQIRSAAVNADVELDPAAAQQFPLLVVMPMKGPASIVAVSVALRVLTGYLKNGGDSVGTVHFAHLMKLPGSHVGFFTLYDGPFDKYAQDFADKLGPAFDLLFRFTKNPPPMPTSKNAGPFTKWVREHDLAPLAFYSRYPGLQVQDVKALLTDAAGSTPAAGSKLSR